MQLIVAVDRNWAIGKGSRLLVRIPEDQRFFREMTMGRVVVYGRKTLSGFPGGVPLAGRTNIVLSRDAKYTLQGAVAAHSEEELFEVLSGYRSEDIFVIGGESVYRMLYPYCETAHVTWIDYSYEADKYFPNLEKEEGWVLTGDSDEQTYFNLEYYFYRYENLKPVPMKA